MLHLHSNLNYDVHTPLGRQKLNERGECLLWITLPWQMTTGTKKKKKKIHAVSVWQGTGVKSEVCKLHDRTTY